MKIRGKRWRIVVRKDLRCELGVVVDGLCDSTARVIYLHADLTGKHRQQRLLHEFNHAVMAEYGMEVLGLPEQVEEMLVNILALELTENLTAIIK